MLSRRINEEPYDFIKRGLQEVDRSNYTTEQNEDFIKLSEWIYNDEFLFLKISKNTADRIFAIIGANEYDSTRTYKQLTSFKMQHKYAKILQIAKINKYKTLFGKFKKNFFEKIKVDKDKNVEDEEEYR